MKRLVLGALAAAVIVACSTAARAAETPIALSETLGDEISRAERDAYHLFPDVRGFVSARVFKLDDGYRVDILYEDGGTQHTRSRRIDDDTFENTRVHVRLVEAANANRSGDRALDARVLYGTALRLATEGRYDVANSLLDDLRRDYPAQYDSLGAATAHDDVRALAGVPRGLFQEGSTLDQSGRTDLMVFAGYYSVWLAIGIPIAFDVESPEGFAAFLLTVPAASLYFTHLATKNRSVTDADAEMISLGGWFGTWQGVGWTAYADDDEIDSESDDVVAAGVLGGVGGIALACLVNTMSEFTAGHAAMMNSANFWGAGLGLLTGVAIENQSDQNLASALIGSAVAVVGTGIAAKDTPLTQRRVRFMNLGGVLGALFGGGIILLGEIDDDAAIASIVAASGIAGGYLAVRMSRPETDERSEMRLNPDASNIALRPLTGWSPRHHEIRVGMALEF